MLIFSSELIETTLFREVPRNYWPALFATISYSGAVSKSGLKVEKAEDCPYLNHVFVDNELFTAFSWAESLQGFAFWQSMWLAIHEGEGYAKLAPR